MTLKPWKSLVVMAAVAATAAGCGDVVRQGRAPVFLTIDSFTAARGAVSIPPYGSPLSSDVLTNVTSPKPCAPETPCPTVFNDLGKVIFAVHMKDVSLSPTSNNNVTLTRYHVEYRRSDGRNTPGVDVPYGFDAGMSITIPAGGTAEYGFELVRVAAKKESPLVQLVQNPGIIQATAEVTFYGHDIVGNEVVVTGSILVDFGNFGDF
jgi:hypothetical protein